MLIGSTRPSGRVETKEISMFARVTYVQAPEGEGEIARGLKLWYQNVLPTTSARDGFRGVLSLVDHKSGKALSVTLWEGDEEMLASTEAEYHKEALERFGEFFQGVHDPENYEVNLYLGPIYQGDEGGPGLEIFKQTQAEAS
jgi:hypothetical protein